MFITSFCGFTISFKLILTVMQYNVTKFITQFCGLFPSTGEGVRKQEMERERGRASVCSDREEKLQHCTIPPWVFKGTAFVTRVIIHSTVNYFSVLWVSAFI